MGPDESLVLTLGALVGRGVGQTGQEGRRGQEARQAEGKQGVQGKQEGWRSQATGEGILQEEPLPKEMDQGGNPQARRDQNLDFDGEPLVHLEQKRKPY